MIGYLPMILFSKAYSETCTLTAFEVLRVPVIMCIALGVDGVKWAAGVRLYAWLADCPLTAELEQQC